MSNGPAPAAEDISTLVRFSESKTSPSGQQYLEPPQCGGTIWGERGLPRWRLLSDHAKMPVAKDYGDGSFYVVTPSTTVESMQAQYRSGSGAAGFEAALEKAWGELKSV